MYDDWVVCINPTLDVVTKKEFKHRFKHKLNGLSMEAGKVGKAKKVGMYNKCSDDHKPVAINCIDKTYYVYGGSCTSPGGANSFKDMDIIVGLDYGMKSTDRMYPWHKGEQFLYRITDMSVPKDIKSFKRLLVYLDARIREGKRVFIGCIGGHGRTGLVLAALITHMTGDKGSASFLRKTYCKKAIESKSQIAWLQKHFDIIPVNPSKGGFGGNHGFVSKSTKSLAFNDPTLRVLKPVFTNSSIFAGCKISGQTSLHI